MYYTKTDSGYMIRLEVGEEFQAAIETFAKKHNISSGFFNGFGALGNVEIGFFNLEKERYESTLHHENYELLNATGNLSMIEGKPFAHTHVTLAKKDTPAFGGHLVKGTVWITAEIFLTTTDKPFIRKQDKTLGFFSALTTDEEKRIIIGQ